MKTKNAISKSRYVLGTQCPKALWLYQNRPDLKPEVSMAQQALFDAGHEIGELAKEYFNGGVEVENPHYDTEGAVEATVSFINAGETLIFEATALAPEGLFSKIDILKKVEGSDEWDLIEVKGSTSVKDYHITDLSAQYFAFTGAVYKIRKCILMHINSKYVRKGELDIKKLFTLEDVTKDILAAQSTVGLRLVDLLKVVNQEKEPSSEIGSRCNSPFRCDYKDYCWSHIPEFSVYDIFRGKKLNSLLDSGVKEVKDIPDDFEMTDLQALNVSSEKSGKEIIDKKLLQSFIDEIQYPAYFLDYETISFGVPQFDNSHAYQQIPFQFSLHIQSELGAECEHVEFLYEGSGDPRRELAEFLVKNCGNSGSVIVYNQSFEERVNKNLAELFPDLSDEILAINKRMIDLIIPFRRKYLYHPKMQTSASIKKVLPAFVPELSYDGLDIGEGESASLSYKACLLGKVNEVEKAKIFKDLRIYCTQDTWAMVKLLDVINSKL